MRDEFVPDIDLGDDHFLIFTTWAPDDLPRNRTWLGIPDGPLPVVEKFGAIIRHYKPDGVMCEGSITFDTEWFRRIHQLNAEASQRDGKRPIDYVAWQVQSWEPLTCSPSLLCHCGDHGHIRDGLWVRA